MIIFLKMNNYNLYTYKSDFDFFVSVKRGTSSPILAPNEAGMIEYEYSVHCVFYESPFHDYPLLFRVYLCILVGN